MPNVTYLALKRVVFFLLLFFFLFFVVVFLFIVVFFGQPCELSYSLKVGHVHNM